MDLGIKMLAWTADGTSYNMDSIKYGSHLFSNFKLVRVSLLGKCNAIPKTQHSLALDRIDLGNYKIGLKSCLCSRL